MHGVGRHGLDDVAREHGRGLGAADVADLDRIAQQVARRGRFARSNRQAVAGDRGQRLGDLQLRGRDGREAARGKVAACPAGRCADLRHRAVGQIHCVVGAGGVDDHVEQAVCAERRACVVHPRRCAGEGLLAGRGARVDVDAIQIIAGHQPAHARIVERDVARTEVARRHVVGQGALPAEPIAVVAVALDTVHLRRRPSACAGRGRDQIAHAGLGHARTRQIGVDRHASAIPAGAGGMSRIIGPDRVAARLVEQQTGPTGRIDHQRIEVTGDREVQTGNTAVGGRSWRVLIDADAVDDVEETAICRTEPDLLGRRDDRADHIGFRLALDILGQGHGLGVVAHRDDVADELASRRRGIDAHAERHLCRLGRREHAAGRAGGTGTDPEHDAVVDGIELGDVVARRIGHAAGGRIGRIGEHPQRTGHIAGVGRNRVGDDHVGRAVLTIVGERDDVLDLFALADFAGRSEYLTRGHATRLLGQRGDKVREEDVSRENQRMREVGVAGAGELQRRAGGAVAQTRAAGVGGCVGDVDQLQIDGELVDVVGILGGVALAQTADATVPEVVGRVQRIAERTGIEHIRAGEPELVAGDATVAFPHERAHVGSELAALRGQQAGDRDRLRAAVRDIAGIAVEHHQAPIGLAVVLVEHDQRPTAVVAQAAAVVVAAYVRSQSARGIGACTRSRHQRGDIAIGRIRTAARITLAGEGIEVAGGDRLIAAGRGPELQRGAGRVVLGRSAAPVEAGREHACTAGQAQGRGRGVLRHAGRQLAAVDVDEPHRHVGAVVEAAVGLVAAGAGQQRVADHLDVAARIEAVPLVELRLCHALREQQDADGHQPSCPPRQHAADPHHDSVVRLPILLAHALPLRSSFGPRPQPAVSSLPDAR